MALSNHNSAGCKTQSLSAVSLDSYRPDVATLRRVNLEPVLFDKSKSGIDQSPKLYDYVIHRYLQPEVKVDEISKQTGWSEDRIRHLLRKFDVFPEKRKQGFHTLKNKSIRTKKFKRELLRLYESGITTISELRKNLNVSARHLNSAAKDLNLELTTNINFVTWETPKNLPKCDIDNYKRYCHVVRHYTNVIYNDWVDNIDPNRQKGSDWHIDHKLSVYDGYHALDEPIPWQMLIHPANLCLISKVENRKKGKNSSISILELMDSIKDFEKSYGKVKLPIHKESNSVSKYTYSNCADTVRKNIKSASYISLSELNNIWKNGISKPTFTKREHLKRIHYEYITHLSLLGVPQKQIGSLLGCDHNVINAALKRIGIPTKIELNYYINNEFPDRIFKFVHSGYNIKQVSEKLMITKFLTLYLFYRFKGE